jgi:Membrane bound beta barrel domain (DUF5777)
VTPKHLALLGITLMLWAPALSAQTAAPPAQSDPDQNLSVVQPDFSLVGLPTTLKLPRHKGSFRVTHRFTRPLGQGSVGSLAGDLFALDSGAQIGLEYRYGLLRGTQVGFNRTNDRTIQFFAEHEVKAQSASFPVTLVAIGSAEGTNNFRDSYSPSLGALVSHTVGDYLALYAEPIWINNSNLLPSEIVDHNDTTILGLGARVRVRPTVYISVEGSPRVAGYAPGVAQMGVGIEKRAGGHLFQMNFSNGLGTMPGPLARGGSSRSEWFLGFNIARKFW